MVYTNRPITKYCCSDSPEVEARILSTFSIVTTLTTMFFLFLIYSHTQSPEFLDRNIAATRNKTSESTTRVLASTTFVSPDSKSEQSISEYPFLQFSIKLSSENISETETEDKASDNQTMSSSLSSLADASTSPSTYTASMNNYTDRSRQSTDGTSYYSENQTEYFVTTISVTDVTRSTPTTTLTPQTTTNSTKKLTRKKPSKSRETSTAGVDILDKKDSATILDSMAYFLLWKRNMVFKRALPLFLWNVMDLLRGILLLVGILKKTHLFLMAWYFLTSVNCLLGLILFVPTIIALTSGAYQAIFILIFLIVLVYNLYGLWIVNLVLKEYRTIRTDEIIVQPQVQDHPIQTPIEVEKF